ncbi:MAG: flagellar hook-basal body complex protein [Vampirovibrionales bacterium]|nr:flagellar hook-basal body complex protein [Vampirovibrionales bacterium]
MTAGLYSAVSGIRANQTRLNVISNNISNVNTIGFKSSDVTFATVFSNTLSGGTTPNGSLGGTNPKQIGNGTLVQDIPVDFSQGGTQYTGRSTDLMINGSGFFVVERIDPNLGTSNTAYYLTRAGNFSLDSNGNLVTAAGNRVRGTAQLSGSLPTTQTNVNIPQEMLIVKDMNATANVIGTHFAQIGTPAATIALQQTAGTVSQNIATVSLVNFSVGRNGSISATYSNGDIITVRVDQGTINPVNPSATRTEIIHMPAEGGTYGADNDGNGVSSQPLTDSGIVDQITGFNVFNAPPGGVAMQGMQLNVQTATVTNPAGLVYDGSNNFLPGANSGTVYFGQPNTGNRGGVTSGSLETSNVDLAGQFSNMIITQRGLEANSRVVRTQSEVLQAIINIV